MIQIKVLRILLPSRHLPDEKVRQFSHRRIAGVLPAIDREVGGRECWKA
jgi:hypothetical protein